MKYKKFAVCSSFGDYLGGKQFFIAVGSIRIRFVLPAINGHNLEELTLIEGENTHVTKKAPFGHFQAGFSGNLDSVKGPEQYSEGFSEQDGIVTYKKGNECIHLNLDRSVHLRHLAIKELGLTELVGKRQSDIEETYARIYRTPKSDAPILEDDFLYLAEAIYEYRYWKDGKEVKYQPNVNRFGTWGAYGDDEIPAVTLANLTDYREATMNVLLKRSFTAGGFQVTIRSDVVGKLAKKHLFISAKKDGSNVLITHPIPGKQIDEITDPTSYGYSGIHVVGPVYGIGKVAVIKAETKDARSADFLAIQLTSVNEDGTIACKLRFWQDKTSGQATLVAEKPKQKAF